MKPASDARDPHRHASEPAPDPALLPSFAPRASVHRTPRQIYGGGEHKHHGHGTAPGQLPPVHPRPPVPSSADGANRRMMQSASATTYTGSVHSVRSQKRNSKVGVENDLVHWALLGGHAPPVLQKPLEQHAADVRHDHHCLHCSACLERMKKELQPASVQIKPPVPHGRSRWKRARKGIQKRAVQLNDLRNAAEEDKYDLLKDAVTSWEYEDHNELFQDATQLLQEHEERELGGITDDFGARSRCQCQHFIEPILMAWPVNLTELRAAVASCREAHGSDTCDLLREALGLLEKYKHDVGLAVGALDGRALFRLWSDFHGALDDPGLASEAALLRERYSMSIEELHLRVGKAPLLEDEAKAGIQYAFEDWAFARNEPVLDLAHAWLQFHKTIGEQCSSDLRSAAKVCSEVVLNPALQHQQATPAQSLDVLAVQDSLNTYWNACRAAGAVCFGVPVESVPAPGRSYFTVYEQVAELSNLLDSISQDSIVDVRSIAVPPKGFLELVAVLMCLLAGIGTVPDPVVRNRIDNSLDLKAAKHLLYNSALKEHLFTFLVLLRLGCRRSIATARAVFFDYQAAMPELWCAAGMARVAPVAETLFKFVECVFAHDDLLQEVSTHCICIRDEDELVSLGMSDVVQKHRAGMMGNPALAMPWVVCDGDPEEIRRNLHFIEEYATALQQRLAILTDAISKSDAFLDQKATDPPQDVQQGMLHVLVQTISGQTITEMHVSDAATGAHLKELVVKTGRPASMQCELLFDGKLIQSQTSLAAQHLPRNALIIVTFVRALFPLMQRLQACTQAVRSFSPETADTANCSAALTAAALMCGLTHAFALQGGGAEELRSVLNGMIGMLYDAYVVICEAAKGRRPHTAKLVVKGGLQSPLPHCLEIPMYNISAASQALRMVSQEAANTPLVELVHEFVLVMQEFYLEFVPLYIYKAITDTACTQALLALKHAREAVCIASSLGIRSMLKEPDVLDTDATWNAILGVNTALGKGQVEGLALQDISVAMPHVARAQLNSRRRLQALLDSSPRTAGEKVRFTADLLETSFSPLLYFQAALAEIAHGLDYEVFTPLLHQIGSGTQCEIQPAPFEVYRLFVAVYWVFQKECTHDVDIRDLQSLLKSPEQLKASLSQWSPLTDGSIPQLRHARALLLRLWGSFGAGCIEDFGLRRLYAWAVLASSLAPLLGTAQALLSAREEVSAMLLRLRSAGTANVAAQGNFDDGDRVVWAELRSMLYQSDDPWWWLSLIGCANAAEAYERHGFAPDLEGSEQCEDASAKLLEEQAAEQLEKEAAEEREKQAAAQREKEATEQREKQAEAQREKETAEREKQDAARREKEAMEQREREALERREREVAEQREKEAAAQHEKEAREQREKAARDQHEREEASKRQQLEDEATAMREREARERYEREEARVREQREIELTEKRRQEEELLRRQQEKAKEQSDKAALIECLLREHPINLTELRIAVDAAMPLFAKVDDCTPLAKATCILTHYENSVRSAVAASDGWALRQLWSDFHGALPRGTGMAELAMQAETLQEQHAEVTQKLHQLLESSPHLECLVKDDIEKCCRAWTFATDDPSLELARVWLGLHASVAMLQLPELHVCAMSSHSDRREQTDVACRAAGAVTFGVPLAQVPLPFRSRVMNETEAVLALGVLSQLQHNDLMDLAMAPKPPTGVLEIIAVVTCFLSGTLDSPEFVGTAHSLDLNVARRCICDHAVLQKLSDFLSWLGSGCSGGAGVILARQAYEKYQGSIPEVWSSEKMTNQSPAAGTLFRFVQHVFAYDNALQQKTHDELASVDCHEVSIEQREEIMTALRTGILHSPLLSIPWFISGGEAKEMETDLGLAHSLSHAARCTLDVYSQAIAHATATKVQGARIEAGDQVILPVQGARPLAITVRRISGEVVAELEVSSAATGAQLKDLIQTTVGGSDSIQQCLLFNGVHVWDHVTLESQGLASGAALTLVDVSVHLQHELQRCSHTLSSCAGRFGNIDERCSSLDAARVLCGLPSVLTPGAAQTEGAKDVLNAMSKMVSDASLVVDAASQGQSPSASTIEFRTKLQPVLPVSLELPLMNICTAGRILMSEQKFSPMKELVNTIFNVMLVFFTEFVPMYIAWGAASGACARADVAAREADSSVALVEELRLRPMTSFNSTSLKALLLGGHPAVSDVLLTASGEDQVQALGVRGLSVAAPHVELAAQTVQRHVRWMLETTPAAEPGDHIHFTLALLQIKVSPLLYFENTLRKIARRIDCDKLAECFCGDQGKDGLPERFRTPDVFKLFVAVFWILQPGCDRDAGIEDVETRLADTKGFRDSLVHWSALHGGSVLQLRHARAQLLQLWAHFGAGCPQRDVLQVLYAWGVLATALWPLLPAAQELAAAHEAALAAWCLDGFATGDEGGDTNTQDRVRAAWLGLRRTLHRPEEPWWWLRLLGADDPKSAYNRHGYDPDHQVNNKPVEKLVAWPSPSDKLQPLEDKAGKKCMACGFVGGSPRAKFCNQCGNKVVRPEDVEIPSSRNSYPEVPCLSEAESKMQFENTRHDLPKQVSSSTLPEKESGCLFTIVLGFLAWLISCILWLALAAQWRCFPFS